MFWVYILQCSDGTLYTGWTNDIAQRLAKHNSGMGARYTKTRLPVLVRHSEGFQTKREAMQREFAIKQMTRKQKLELIALASQNK